MIAETLLRVLQLRDDFPIGAGLFVGFAFEAGVCLGWDGMGCDAFE